MSTLNGLDWVVLLAVVITIAAWFIRFLRRLAKPGCAASGGSAASCEGCRGCDVPKGPLR